MLGKEKKESKKKKRKEEVKLEEVGVFPISKRILRSLIRATNKEKTDIMKTELELVGKKLDKLIEEIKLLRQENRKI